MIPKLVGLGGFPLTKVWEHSSSMHIVAIPTLDKH